MKKSEKLYDAITGISDEYIEEKTIKPKEKFSIRGWLPAIACAACIALFVGVFKLLPVRVDMPATDAPAADEAPKGGDYIGHNEGYTFMSYGGPVFPMTLLEENGDITAGRHITYNIAANAESAIVTDAYTLTNTSSEDKTVTAVYPFNGNLFELESQMPKIIAGGNEIEPAIHEGTYSGKFIGILGPEGAEEGGSYNLDNASSWEDYKKVLADGSYMANAFGEMRDLDQEVIVYKFTNHKSTGEYAASLGISFDRDSKFTKILTLGINGHHETDDHATYSYFLTHAERDKKAVYILVFGEDIKNCTIQGYKNGACNKGEELPGATADVERYETTFGEVIKEHIANGGYAISFDKNEVNISEELFYHAVCGLMYKHGPMSEGPAQRYSYGRLDDVLLETLTHDRVFYLAFDVTIPAGESVEISAKLTKEASFDFDCSGSEGSGLRGYDMVTDLGSNLNYAEQKATVVNKGILKIVRNNFGFDLENGIDTVTLDTAVEHYYMEVRKVIG